MASLLDRQAAHWRNGLMHLKVWQFIKPILMKQLAMSVFTNGILINAADLPSFQPHSLSRVLREQQQYHTRFLYLSYR